MTEKSMTIFNYLKENQGKDLTSTDIAVGLNLMTEKVDGEGNVVMVPNRASVDGVITGALVKHREIVDGEKVIEPLAVRVPAEITLEDGSHKKINLIELTEFGKNYVPTLKAE